jgi:hypothetical protein
MSIPSQSRQAWLTAVLPVGMILVACLGAWNFPGTFQDLSWAIVPGLMLVMFGMGITIDGDQLGDVARKPGIRRRRRCRTMTKDRRFLNEQPAANSAGNPTRSRYNLI